MTKMKNSQFRFILKSLLEALTEAQASNEMLKDEMNLQTTKIEDL